jgi:hypothetical protein
MIRGDEPVDAADRRPGGHRSMLIRAAARRHVAAPAPRRRTRGTAQAQAQVAEACARPAGARGSISSTEGGTCSAPNVSATRRARRRARVAPGRARRVAPASRSRWPDPEQLLAHVGERGIARSLRPPPAGSPLLHREPARAGLGDRRLSSGTSAGRERGGVGLAIRPTRCSSARGLDDGSSHEVISRDGSNLPAAAPSVVAPGPRRPPC